MNDHHDSVAEECFAPLVYHRMSNTLREIVQEQPDREVPAVCVVEGIADLAGAVAGKIEDMTERNETVAGAICSVLSGSNCDIGAVLRDVRDLMEDELQPAGHA